MIAIHPGWQLAIDALRFASQQGCRLVIDPKGNTYAHPMALPVPAGHFAIGGGIKQQKQEAQPCAA